MTVWQERDNYIRRQHPTVDWDRYKIMWGIDDEGQPTACAVPVRMSPRDGFEIDPDTVYRANQYVPELRPLVRRPRTEANESRNLRMPPASDPRHWTWDVVDDNWTGGTIRGGWQHDVIRAIDITSGESIHVGTTVNGRETLAPAWTTHGDQVPQVSAVLAVDPVRPPSE